MNFRKTRKGRIRGRAKAGDTLSFGEYGLMAVESGRISARQIEAARIAMTRRTKRGGQVWIKIFPDVPVTKKPAEVRMGKGKGAVDKYVAKVRAGRILYEMGGVELDVATEALMLAAAKLPLKTQLLLKDKDPWI
jgi:large subunit ribosomal protein L16